MATKGYQSYRGRGGLLKGLTAAVLILILLAACAFMLALQYVTYTDDGGMRLDLPFLEKSIELNLPVFFRPAPQPAEPEPADEGPEIELIIEGEGDGEGEAPAPEEPQAPAAVERRLVALAQLPADPAALAAQVEAAGASGFVWTARDRTGGVNYASGEAIAAALTAGGPDMETVKALCEGTEVYAVARLGCFHDNSYAFANMAEAAICQKNGYVWYSGNSDHWLDPDKAEARRYVIALAVECAQMGFDEVLLDDVSYPVEGKLQKIDYSKNTLGKTEALTLFLTELRQALEPYGARVSLALDETLLLAGSGADSGQSLTAFAPLADAVYTAAADPGTARLQLEAAAGEGPCPDLVLVASAAALPAEGSWCLAE